MVKIYIDEESSKGWVAVDGDIEAARSKIRAAFYEYDMMDCDNSWSTFAAIAVDDVVVEGWVGSFEFWLGNRNRNDAEIYKVSVDDFKKEGINISLNPRKDYILI